MASCYVLKQLSPRPAGIRPFCGIVHKNVAGWSGGIHLKTAMPASRPLEERFWEKVHKETHISSPHVDTPCWRWTAYLNPTGYGSFKYEGKIQRVHRISWQIHNGLIPFGLNVLHKCDIRNCVNPSHLFLGTQLENNQDREAKGRGNQPHGEGIASSKLTEIKVIQMRSMYATGKFTQRQLASIFSIHQTSVTDVLSGETWKHLDRPNKNFTRRGPCKLSKEDILEIRRLISEGIEQQSLAIRFNISQSAISMAARGKTYKHLFQNVEPN